METTKFNVFTADVLDELRAIEALSTKLRADLIRLNARLEAGELHAVIERRAWSMRDDEDDGSD